MPKPPIPDTFAGLPAVTTARMREIDAEATAKHGIPADVLMENAGRAVAAEVLKAKPGKVVVCCGRGNNGGDGLIAARALREAGCRVSVFIAPPKKEAGYPPLVAAALELVRDLVKGDEALRPALADCDAAVDALLGTGSAGKPAGAVHHMIHELTRARKPVYSIDVPTGLQPDTGYHSGAVVAATVTLALGLPIRGLLSGPAKRFVGELRVLDIGYPKELLHA